MKRALFAVSLVVAAVASCGRRPEIAGPRALSQALSHGGIDRTYRLYVPPRLDRGRAAPLVLALHGHGGDGARMEELSLGRLDRLADRDGFLIAYPDGIDRGWNDGAADSSNQHPDVDDEGFLVALVDSIAGRYSIDRARVFVTGMSNGGFMAARLACARSDVFAAFAPVAAGLRTPGCAPSRAVSMLFVNGTDDPLVIYGGTEVRFGRRVLSSKLTTAAAVDLFAQRGGCSSPPSREPQPDRDTSDGTSVVIERREGCRDGAEVLLYRVDGGGHTWPGGHQYFGEGMIGRTSREFDASDVVWEFFRRHTLAQAR